MSGQDDKDFEQSGIFKAKLEIIVKVDEQDLLHDLVQKTENVKLKIDEPKGFENN